MCLFDVVLLQSYPGIAWSTWMVSISILWSPFWFNPQVGCEGGRCCTWLPASLPAGRRRASIVSHAPTARTPPPALPRVPASLPTDLPAGAVQGRLRGLDALDDGRHRHEHQLHLVRASMLTCAGLRAAGTASGVGSLQAGLCLLTTERRLNLSAPLTHTALPSNTMQVLLEQVAAGEGAE